MATSTQNRREPLGLFADRSAPRLYDRLVEVVRVCHYSRRTEEAYLHWMRLLEALRLRVEDLDFERGEITVREGKGDKDRVTTTPRAVIHPLQEHLQRVQAIHQQALAGGYGRVELPHALVRKYPNANRDWVGSSCSRKNAAGAIRRPGTRGVITSTNLWFREP